MHSYARSLLLVGRHWREFRVEELTRRKERENEPTAHSFLRMNKRGKMGDRERERKGRGRLQQLVLPWVSKGGREGEEEEGKGASQPVLHPPARGNHLP